GPRGRPAYEPVYVGRSAGEGLHPGGNAEGAGLGNRFTQKVDQRVVDGRVGDASGSEKKPQWVLLRSRCRWCIPQRDSPEAHKSSFAGAIGGAALLRTGR